jgi:plasmid stabilization system protein ParE
MARELVVRPEAEAELAEAFKWYEERVPGLGTDFLLAVDAAFHSILRNPQQYSQVYRTVRRALLRRFPYAIFFVADAARVTVIAVFHAKRNPKKWQQRQ